MKNPLVEAKRWYEQAWNDWEFVQWLSNEDKFYDKGCFIAQQACEKAMKACLYASGERFVVIHSTFELAERMLKFSPEFEKIVDAAKRLDRFYIPTRYPNGLPGGVPFKHFTRDDFENAVSDGNIIISQCQKYLRKTGLEL